MKKNKALSITLGLLALCSLLLGISLSFMYFFSDFDFTLMEFIRLQLLVALEIPDATKSEYPLLKVTGHLINGLMNIFIPALVAIIFIYLSRRFQFNSFSEMKAHDEREWENSFTDCGNIIDINHDESGIFKSPHVTIKTTNSVYRGIGRIGNVTIGSPLRMQGDDLIVIDNGVEKRLSIVS